MLTPSNISMFPTTNASTSASVSSRRLEAAIDRLAHHLRDPDVVARASVVGLAGGDGCDGAASRRGLQRRRGGGSGARSPVVPCASARPVPRLAQRPGAARSRQRDRRRRPGRPASPPPVGARAPPLLEARRRRPSRAPSQLAPSGGPGAHTVAESSMCSGAPSQPAWSSAAARASGASRRDQVAVDPVAPGRRAASGYADGRPAEPGRGLGIAEDERAGGVHQRCALELVERGGGDRGPATSRRGNGSSQGERRRAAATTRARVSSGVVQQLRLEGGRDRLVRIERALHVRVEGRELDGRAASACDSLQWATTSISGSSPVYDAHRGVEQRERAVGRRSSTRI